MVSGSTSPISLLGGDHLDTLVDEKDDALVLSELNVTEELIRKRFDYWLEQAGATQETEGLVPNKFTDKDFLSGIALFSIDGGRDIAFAIANQRGRIVACNTTPRGSTCWNTPNCPTESTCSNKPCILDF